MSGRASSRRRAVRSNVRRTRHLPARIESAGRSLVQLATKARHMHRSVARIEARGGVFFPRPHARRQLADIAGSRRTRGRTAIRQRICHAFQPSACVAPQGHFGGDAASDLFRDNVEMNDRDVGGRYAKRLVAISPSLQPTTIRQSDASISSFAMRDSVRTGRPTADWCRRCRLCRSWYARPESTAPRRTFNAVWPPTGECHRRSAAMVVLPRR